MGSGGSGFSLSSINPYAKAAQAGIQAFQSGVGAYFQTKTAKAMANSQAAIAGYQAETIRANKTVQDIENRQQLAAMGRHLSQETTGYRDVVGRNAAEAGAGNVDISSGSVAAVQEGNAQRYAQDVAAIRRAYDLQRWNGESQLSMMEAQAKGYDKMSSAYRTVARLQGSAFGNAFSAASMSLLGSFLGGSFDGLMGSKTPTPKTGSPGGPIGYNAVGHQHPSYYESMGVIL